MGRLVLPAPPELGLPAHLQSWRPNQPEAILEAWASGKPYIGIVAPTGFGKTSMYMGHAAFADERTVTLTATNSLLSQITTEFRGFATDVRGQANYQCNLAPVRVSDGPCHLGLKCDLRDSGCSYYDAKRRAAHAQRVATNYQFWFHGGLELGGFDRVVLDEAHNAFGELARFLHVQFGSWESANILRGERPPEDTWPAWAKRHFDRLSVRFSDIQRRHVAGESSAGEAQEGHRLRAVLVKLRTLAGADPKEWVMESRRPGWWDWDCVWPGRYAKQLLFRGAPKFTLTSATLTRKAFQLLGVPAGEYEFVEYPSNFPVDRRPIYYYPVARLTHQSELDGDAVGMWVHTMDRIIEQRLKRKGIIHSVSYKRGELIQRLSRHGDKMILYEGSADLPRAVAEFRAAAAPKILVGPSLGEGLDFPGAQCEYTIISKVPFAPPSALSKAREARDPDFGLYEVMMDVVQSAGRGMRSAEDRNEVFILDGVWGWFSKQAGEFAPAWFWEAVQQVDRLPRPAPRLTA